ncbi:MAG: hypothetical protein ACOCV1_04150 [Bacillota bacterium]
MKAVCKNPKNYNLSLEKPYEVISTLNDFYVIQNDKGLVRSYNKALFVEEVEVPVKELTIEDISFTVVVADSSRGYITLFLGDSEKEDDYEFVLDEVAGNCGVISFEGVNDTYGGIFNEITDLLIEKDIDANNEQIHNLTKQVFEDIVIKLVDQAANDDKAMLVFSTNDEWKEIWEVLDRLSDFQTPEVNNPGSGSQIKLWILYV